MKENYILIIKLLYYYCMLRLVVTLLPTLRTEFTASLDLSMLQHITAPHATIHPILPEKQATPAKSCYTHLKSTGPRVVPSSLTSACLFKCKP